MHGLIRAIDAFEDSALACSDLPALRHLLDAAANELGFRHFAIVRHVWIANDNAGWDSLNDYPEGWAEEFIGQRHYLGDPVLGACQRALRIFRWSDVPRLLPLSRGQRHILERSSRFGMGEGLTVPAHVPGEPPASCSFALKPGHAPSMTQTMAAQLLGLVACEAMRRLNGYPLVGRTPILSPTQRDCLALIATSHNDKMAARKLGIAPEQVADHIKKARDKFGARTRAEAVMHALRDSQIFYAAPRPHRRRR